jgi:hypothetical protein
MTGVINPEQYEKLIERLLDLQRRQPAVDPLTASLEALIAVLDFLIDEPRFVFTGDQSQALRPLWRLLFALMDRAAGSKPKLFFDPPIRPNKGGAPSYTSAVFLRAIVNVALLGLCEAGIPQQNATKWLAAELKHAGISQKGRLIDARILTRWRSERGGKALKGSDQAFAIFVRASLQKLLEQNPQAQSDDATPDPQGAKMAAAGLVKLLKFLGF